MIDPNINADTKDFYGDLIARITSGFAAARIAPTGVRKPDNAIIYTLYDGNDFMIIRGTLFELEERMLLNAKR